MNHPPDEILIWGAGAIGGTVGAFLQRAGQPVRMVDLVPEHLATIRAPGLRISGPVDEFTVAAPACTPEELRGSWNRIFLCVKAHHTAEAARALRPHLAADGHVVSLQNGLCEGVIAEAVGAERVIGAFVNFGADYLEPGHVLLGNRAAVVVGELDGRITPRLRALRDTLALFEPEAVVTDDIHAFLWGKLGYGAMLFAQALGQGGIADAFARPELEPAFRRLGQEAVAVALAEGVAPRGFNGFDPDAFRPEVPPDAARASIAAMERFNRGSAKTHSGIWRDLAIRKRRTEAELQLHPVIAAGARHGIPCPGLRRLAAMIREIEDGARPMRDENLLELIP